MIAQEISVFLFLLANFKTKKFVLALVASMGLWILLLNLSLRSEYMNILSPFIALGLIFIGTFTIILLYKSNVSKGFVAFIDNNHRLLIFDSKGALVSIIEKEGFYYIPFPYKWEFFDIRVVDSSQFSMVSELGNRVLYIDITIIAKNTEFAYYFFKEYDEATFHKKLRDSLQPLFNQRLTAKEDVVDEDIIPVIHLYFNEDFFDVYVDFKTIPPMEARK